jgi:hypothetical protein
MYLNTLDVKLTPRPESPSYNLKVNESTVEMLCLVFEFKVAAGWHISRFLVQEDQNKYIYLKLRRMWLAGFLESFKVFSGSLAGIPVFYMLSKAGLKILAERGKYSEAELHTYPNAKTLLSWGLFKHEAQVVEIASLEVKNKSKNLNITCKGEVSSLSRELMSNKNIEVLSPDYIVLYQMGSVEQLVYTEFERTIKSKEAMLKKIARYLRHWTSEERSSKTLRFIFQTPQMEQLFWLNLLSNQSGLLQKLKILTTNLSLLQDYKQFLEPVYLSEQTVRLLKHGKLTIDPTERIKLFAFL